MKKTLPIALSLTLASLGVSSCTDRQPTGPLSVPSPEFAVVSGSGPGKIVVNHDEWTLTNFGFGQAPDAAQFALNVASWFTGGGTGDFLVFSTNFGLVGSSVTSTMTGAGHTWKINLGESFTLPNLLQYDAIFLAGNPANNTVLINYVNAGGNVYLAGGTGFGGAIAEAARWNTFLNAFNLNFGAPYNVVLGVRSVPTSSHPIFASVGKLYQNNGNSVSELNAADPNTDILDFAGPHGLYGVFGLAVIGVEIDIKPGSDPNCIKKTSKGTIPVAILASANYNVADVDVSTVGIDGVGPVRSSLNKDVSGDGQPDLVLQFSTVALNTAGLLTDGNTLNITGALFDGTPIQGSDVIFLAGGPNCFD